MIRMFAPLVFAILIALPNLNSSSVFAQTLQPLKQSANRIASPQASAPVQAKAAKDNKPYKITSRIHLQKGANKGYLVVQVELAKETYIYSLTQKGNIPPTKIQVAPSAQFRLTGTFNPDRPATVIEHDPVMNERVEKHKDKIQFFAPIEIAAGQDVATIIADVTFRGQACTNQGFCMPIPGAKAQGKFASYFERTAEAQGNSQSANNGTKVR